LGPRNPQTFALWILREIALAADATTQIGPPSMDEMATQFSNC
jgi:hypothetical protein